MCIIFSELESQRQNYELIFWESSMKKRLFYLISFYFIACGLILLPSELFQIVISCKIVNCLMKFKFIHQALSFRRSVLSFFNLLRGPDITILGAGSGPRVVHPCCIRIWIMEMNFCLRFENHYNSVHRNACSVCFRFFPNQHLLDLHLAEQHDQMFQLMVAKKPMVRLQRGPW